jgi:chromosome partitioning protein
MKVISVLNHKGGVGKSTFATNICAYYANKGNNVLLGDFDVQQSSYNWNMLRPSSVPQIEIMEFEENGSPKKPKNNIDYVVIDSPAGIRSDALHRLVYMSDKIITPIKPSSFDILSTGTFLEEISEIIEEIYIEKNKIVDLCLVGNMIEGRTLSSENLHQFIKKTGIYHPLSLRQSQVYVNLTAYGLSIFDSQNVLFNPDKKAWEPLFDWIDNNNNNQD